MDSEVTVTVDGQAVQLAQGATVVAALVIAGQLGTRRSVTGEARFALCGMGFCQECRVTIDGRQHGLACQVRCVDGMVIATTAAQAP